MALLAISFTAEAVIAPLGWLIVSREEEERSVPCLPSSSISPHRTHFSQLFFMVMQFPLSLYPSHPTSITWEEKSPHYNFARKELIRNENEWRGTTRVESDFGWYRWAEYFLVWFGPVWFCWRKFGCLVAIFIVVTQKILHSHFKVTKG